MRKTELNPVVRADVTAVAFELITVLPSEATGSASMKPREMPLSENLMYRPSNVAVSLSEGLNSSTPAIVSRFSTRERDEMSMPAGTYLPASGPDVIAPLS